jgi:hypothetical protein
MRVLFFLLGLLLDPKSLINADQRAPPITCKVDSFEIIQATPPIVDEITVTFFYKLNLTKGINLNSVDFRDYVDECFDFVQIAARVKGDIQYDVIKEFKIPKDAPLQYSIPIQVTDLLPITTYEFQFRHQQITPFNNLRFEPLVEVSTCFGEPAKVKQISKSLQADGSVMITWKQPDVIRAPFICFYLIEKIKLNNSERIETKETSYKVRRDEIVDKVEIRISAYNDQKCYQLPTGCKNGTKSSGVDIIKFDESLLPNTTKKPNNSILIKSNSLLTIFAMLILFIVL